MDAQDSSEYELDDPVEIQYVLNKGKERGTLITPSAIPIRSLEQHMIYKYMKLPAYSAMLLLPFVRYPYIDSAYF